MTDNARIEKGDLIVNLDDLINNLSQDQKNELAKTVAFKDAYKQVIVELICDDMTEDGWGMWSSGSPLTEVRVQILERLGDVEYQVVKDLLKVTQDAKEKAKRMWDSYWNLYHWAQNHKCKHCDLYCGLPKLKPFSGGKQITDTQIREVLAARDLQEAVEAMVTAGKCMCIEPDDPCSWCQGKAVLEELARVKEA